MKQIFFNHLRELLLVKIHLRDLIQFCKSHSIWDSRPPILVSHVDDLERRIREREGGIYDI